MTTKYDRLFLAVQEYQSVRKELSNVGYDPCGDQERRLKEELSEAERKLDLIFDEMYLAAKSRVSK